jgi:hypothetical protein
VYFFVIAKCRNDKSDNIPYVNGINPDITNPLWKYNAPKISPDHANGAKMVSVDFFILSSSVSSGLKPILPIELIQDTTLIGFLIFSKKIPVSTKVRILLQ